MTDVLPPKRQTVVDRLRRRLELYRRHQGSCQPRYDQAANGIYDAQRHETLLLKQRFLEAKAKKTKRADNRHSAAPRDNVSNNNNIGNNNGDVKSAIVPQSKLKRAAGSPLLDYENMGDNHHHPNKMPRNPTPDHLKNSSQQQKQSQQQQQPAGMPSFSVQIVQQFTSSNTSQAPHSQTIQTNVTVQALSGGSIKTSNSPITAASPADNSNGGLRNPSGCNMSPVVNGANGGGGGNGGPSSTSISVGASIECKQEPNSNFAPCSVNASSHHPNNGNDVGCGDMHSREPNGAGGGNPVSTVETSTLGDRFSDSLANLGFPEDSSDDVIHPDILKDIIDDVFTNPSDLMNGFSFVDNLKDTGIGDEKDPVSHRNLLQPDTKNLVNTNCSNPQQTQFHNTNSSPSMNQFTMSQSQQSVFDFQTGVLNSSSSQLTNVTPSQGFGQARTAMAPPYASSNSMQAVSGSGAGLNLDFKLSEPSPAAQTLKQMAEQHQNMQQKQQQLGLGMGPGHPRASFVSDNFADPLTNIRSNFLSGSQASSISQLAQKGPTNNGGNIFQSVGGFNHQQQQQQQQQQQPPPQQQQQGFVGSNNVVGTAVKQEVGSPVLPPGYASSINSQLADSMDMNKRRQQQQQQHQQILQLQQQQQQQQQQRPSYSHSPDQKNMNSGSPFPGGMPLSHYSDAMSRGSASNSPISHPGQFMRGGIPTPGVTPPPTNFNSPSPSGATVHLSQSQQIQVSQNSGQQLQVSQSQQQLLMSHDLKPSVTVQAQQQQQVQSRSFYPGSHQSVHMSQSQSMNFQFGVSQANANNQQQQQQQQQQNLAQHQQQQQRAAAAQQSRVSPSPSNNPAGQQQQQQRHVPQYAGRPPPDYQSPVGDQSTVISSHMSQGMPIQQQQPQQRTTSDNRGAKGRKAAAAASAMSSNAHAYAHMDQNSSVQQQHHAMMNNPIHSVPTTTGRGRGRGRGSVAKQNSTRHQRPPNVNVGPEGLNISQRPPVSTDWRHAYMSQQQQQINSANLQIRIPYSRTGPANYVHQQQQQQILTSNPSNFNTGNVMIDPTSHGHLQGNPMPVTSRLANSMSGGVMTSTTAAPNSHILMQQQHQQILIQQQQQQHQQHQNVGKTPDQMMVTSSMPSMRESPSALQHSQHMYDIAAAKPVASMKLDDVSHHGLPADNSDILDFLDNICSTSDLLNFDIGGGNSGSGFPLLDDMLGK